MNLLFVVCFGFVGFFAAVHCTLIQGNQIILTDSSRSIALPKLNTKGGNDFSCSWKIISSDKKIIQVELKKFLSNTKCDCDCGRISVAHGLNKKLGVYCQNDLPVMLQSHEQSLEIVFESVKDIIGHNLETTPLFRYDIKSKHRSKRESGNDSIANTKPNDGSNASMNNSVANGNTHSGSKLTRLPVLIPAILTVVIFVACVSCIAYKNYNIEEFPFSGSAPDITEEKDDICCSAKRRKNARKHSKNELYDVMLKQYKTDTLMKHPSRKSSTINVQGAEGNDPQSIARKHLILRHMREPRKSSGSGAVEALIKLSSKALIASSMVQNEKENGNKSREELSMLLEDESLSKRDSMPKWQQENLDSFENLDNNIEEIPTEKRFSTDDKSYLICPPENNSKKRNSGSAWFKYKRLEKQSFVDDDDSDEELKYDCAQHIQRILSASKENLEEAKRILPDDVKDIVLPEDLEAALAEFEFWPDSSV